MFVYYYMYIALIYESNTQLFKHYNWKIQSLKNKIL